MYITYISVGKSTPLAVIGPYGHLASIVSHIVSSKQMQVIHLIYIPHTVHSECEGQQSKAPKTFDHNAAKGLLSGSRSKTCCSILAEITSLGQISKSGRANSIFHHYLQCTQEYVISSLIDTFVHTLRDFSHDRTLRTNTDKAKKNVVFRKPGNLVISHPADLNASVKLCVKISVKLFVSYSSV